MHAPVSRQPDYILIYDEIAKEGLDILGKRNVLDGVTPDTATGLMCRSEKIFPVKYKKLKAIARSGTGIDNVDMGQATAAGIPVFFAPGENANSVYEYVFHALGAYARKMKETWAFRLHLAAMAKEKTLSDDEVWALIKKAKKDRVGFELKGKKLAVIGLGNIGKMVAEGGLDRGMQVAGWDPNLPDESWDAVDTGVTRALTLQELLEWADVVSIHIPLTAKTRGYIGAKEIAWMRDGTILVNYARSGLCDYDAVLAALDSDRLAQYIADLTDTTPLKVLLHPKVMWTEHVGAGTKESEVRCSVAAATYLGNFLQFGTVVNAANFPKLEDKPEADILTRICVVNKDVPDMIASITHVLGKAQVSIASFVNKSNDIIGYDVADLRVHVDPALVEEIRRLPGVINAHALTF